MHFDFQHAIALASFAAATLDVETKPPGIVASNLCGRKPGKEIADFIEDAAVSRRVAAGCAANGRLVDYNGLIERVFADDLAMGAGPLLGSEPVTEQGPAQNVIHQSAFARTAHASDAGQRADRDADIDVLEIIFGCAQHFQPSFLCGRRHALFRDGNG